MSLIKNLITLILISFLLGACGDDDNDGGGAATNSCDVAFSVAALSIVDHADPLTDAANDNGFTLTIDTATGVLPLDCFDIAAQSATSGDMTYWIMIITHNDNDGDTFVSEGDSFVTVEAPVDVYPATDNGQTLDVNLTKDFPANPSLIGSGSWTDL
jgi:hypothetical protein